MSEGLSFDSVLIFCPHPDDAEFMSGGSMARWSAEGKKVTLVVVTNGAAGSNDPDVDREWLIRTREEEQRRAAEILGVQEVVFLGYEDGYIEDGHELRRDMIREIRRYKPDLAVGLDPTTHYWAGRYINHPDHRRVGQAFLAAVNPGSTTVPLYRKELYDQGFEPHQLRYVLLGFTTEPDYFVDITDHVDKKVEAIFAHTSQMENMERALDDIGERVREMGAMVSQAGSSGYKYAEGYRLFRLSDEAQSES